MAILKTEVDKLDIDKLIPVPADLSWLSEVVKNKKTKYNTGKLNLEKALFLILVDLLKNRL